MPQQVDIFKQDRQDKQREAYAEIQTNLKLFANQKNQHGSQCQRKSGQNNYHTAFGGSVSCRACQNG